MSPADIVEQVEKEGVILTLSASGKLLAKGDSSAIDRWVSLMKQNKQAIITELLIQRRYKRILTTLIDDPAARYAVHVLNADEDPVTVTIGIRNVAVFEMHIPHEYFDPFALLELIEEHTLDISAVG